MNWIRNFLTTDQVPRWQVFAVGVVAFIASLLVNELNYQRSVNDANVREAQQRTQARLLEVQRHSVEFQTYAGAFVSAVLDGKEDFEEERQRLIGNILAQDAAVELSFSVLGERDSVAVSEFRSALRKMRDEVENVGDVVSMGPFWEAAANLLDARNQLLQTIESRSSDPST